MATAGDILVSESSLDNGQAQLHLLNIIGTGIGGVRYITQEFSYEVPSYPDIDIDMENLSVAVSVAEANVDVSVQEITTNITQEEVSIDVGAGDSVNISIEQC
jgi:hypothetical protein